MENDLKPFARNKFGTVLSKMKMLLFVSHGMSWAEYALSRLQLGDVSVMKLIPKLPAVAKVCEFCPRVKCSVFVFLIRAYASLSTFRVTALTKMCWDSCQMLFNPRNVDYKKLNCLSTQSKNLILR